MKSEDNFYDHYKDSYSILKGYLQKRDRLTIIVFAMIIVILFQIESPVDIESIFKSLWSKNISNNDIEFKYINSLLHIVFLWFVMQYYQITLTIENSYSYIHELETKLSDDKLFEIKREGVNYLESYPWLKSVTHRLFVLLMPILIIGTAAIKIIVECIECYKFMVFDCAILGIIIVLTLLYLSNRFFYESAFDKKKYPNVSCCIRIKHYFIHKNK